MVKSGDEVSSLIISVIQESEEPLETMEIYREIQKELKKATRTIVLYRLNMLRGEQKIRGKFVGSGKGVWIWWANKSEGRKK